MPFRLICANVPILQELKFGLYEWIPDGRPGGGRHLKQGSEVSCPTLKLRMLASRSLGPWTAAEPASAVHCSCLPRAAVPNDLDCQALG